MLADVESKVPNLVARARGEYRLLGADNISLCACTHEISTRTIDHYEDNDEAELYRAECCRRRTGDWRPVEWVEGSPWTRNTRSKSARGWPHTRLRRSGTTWIRCLVEKQKLRASRSRRRKWTEFFLANRMQSQRHAMWNKERHGISRIGRSLIRQSLFSNWILLLFCCREDELRFLAPEMESPTIHNIGRREISRIGRSLIRQTLFAIR